MDVLSFNTYRGFELTDLDDTSDGYFPFGLEFSNGEPIQKTPQIGDFVVFGDGEGLAPRLKDAKERVAPLKLKPYRGVMYQVIE